MKLSDKTISILKNFSSINQSIAFKEGKKLKTMSVMRNILAEAEIEEYIPKDFAIYDLPQFLNSIGLHADPDIDLEQDTHLTIRDGKTRRSRYFFSDPTVIVSPPENELTLPTQDVCFVLQQQQLEKLLKASNILQLPDLCAVGEAGVVKLVVTDKRNETANEYSIVVGETDKEFTFNFKMENIKTIPSTYEVVIAKKGLARFVSNDYNLTYYIALEPDSKFAE
jgi:hypothetical protein